MLCLTFYFLSSYSYFKWKITRDVRIVMTGPGSSGNAITARRMIRGAKVVDESSRVWRRIIMRNSLRVWVHVTESPLSYTYPSIRHVIYLWTIVAVDDTVISKCLSDTFEPFSLFLSNHPSNLPVPFRPGDFYRQRSTLARFNDFLWHTYLPTHACDISTKHVQREYEKKKVLSLLLCYPSAPTEYAFSIYIFAWIVVVVFFQVFIL